MLRWFQQVADGMTVTEVADLDMVSQPGVSRALARLEKEVGAPLLHRSGRTLRMTRAGAAFKRHVDALLHELDDGLAAVDQLVDPSTGTVALAFQPSFGSLLVPDLVRSFHDVRPGVGFELAQVRSEGVVAVLESGAADLALAGRLTDAAVTWRRLLTEPLRLAVHEGHPLAGRAGVALAEAASEPFAALRPASLLRRQSEELCQRAGFRPRVVLEADELPTVHGLVAAGLAVAVLPAGLAAGPGPSSVRLLPLEDPGATREVGLAWSAERRLLPSAQAFADHVLHRAAAGELPVLR
ncbi:DNA-binding transcriptional LysR family regulator [Kineococcus xinjiangensis]|uniref:DNA-binding transcriptional LysR family regulator n=1 Tax=Kineococcus xinjiangensis TaxID=512762 RepID=A0A2S6IH51_9ACTN|nr:DNA-binding transcriptional LysR family regulator [Kineococcus xinjiangensis]